MAVEVFFGELHPEAVHGEINTDLADRGDPMRQAMTRSRAVSHVTGGWGSGANVRATRGTFDYTAPLVSRRAGVAIPLESSQILWQR